MNPYDILGVDRYCSIDEIKAQYRILAHRHHPDKGGDPEIFKQINQAYDILTDPLQRQSYNDTGLYFFDASILKEAKDQLHRLLFTAIDKLDIENSDIVLSMKVQARQIQESVKIDISNVKKFKAKLLRVRSKMRQKRDQDSILKDMLTKRIETCDTDIKNFQRRLVVCSYMLIILENYHYSTQEFIQLLGNAGWSGPGESNSA